MLPTAAALELFPIYLQDEIHIGRAEHVLEFGHTPVKEGYVSAWIDGDPLSKKSILP